MLVAVAQWRLACSEIPHGLIAAKRHQTVEQRHVDVLADAGRRPVIESREDRDSRIETGDHISDGDAHLLRAAARPVVTLAGNAHQAAKTLENEIIARLLRIRPILPVAGDRAVNEPRIGGAKALMVETV